MSIMNPTTTADDSCIDYANYPETTDGFRSYFRDLADGFFMFPGYRTHQDEILYEAIEAFFVDGYKNVVIEGPTGIGKSGVNVTIAMVVSWLNKHQRQIRDYFGVNLQGLDNGKAFLTTPQKSLRNQLAEDDDLQEHISMLKSRRDYTCGVSNNNCADCWVRSDDNRSCMTEAQCSYWMAKEESMDEAIATITFAMLIVDNYLPVVAESGQRLSYDDRDIVIVDEGHDAESQSSSLFAGFTLSPWVMPEEVYGTAGDEVDWDADRLGDVAELVEQIRLNAENYILEHENIEQYQSQVENCENILRKIEYCQQTAEDGRGWVVNVDEIAQPGPDSGTTKNIEVKPVRVDDFLSEFVWSRGRRRLITSATIPFRGDIDKWADRIGLDGRTKFISKPTPFPVEHRKIHLNTTVGEMSGSSEDFNWNDAMDQIGEIHSHHEGEKGLIHSVSYPRAEEVADSLDQEVIVDEKEKETAALITRWQNSDTDIMVSPTMMAGVDLYEDRCRWQVILKAPFAYAADSRVDYLLNEEYEWDWYFEETAMQMIQAIGRAVRGPEPEEAATCYVIDEKFDEVMHRTTPPSYIGEAVTEEPPEHWDDPDAAPWR
jgi:Rad3-related DNA helicase